MFGFIDKLFSKSLLYSKQLVGYGLLLTLFILIIFLFKTYNFHFEEKIDPAVWGQLGDIIGGIVGTLFSLISVLLLYRTLILQQGQNKVQQKQYKEQQFAHSQQQLETENFFIKEQISIRFYELLKIQRENSNKITVKNKVGRKVFMQMERELNECYTVVKGAKILYPSDNTNLELINLSYLLFFYGGVGERSERIVKRSVSNTFSDAFLKYIFETMNNNKDHIKTSKRFDWVPFDGHQARLGHYYRHLFQSIKYINQIDEKVLSYEEKYQYVKTLRAQLTVNEQVLLLWNSLSYIGKAWEKEENLEINSQLITKYNLIKNIPLGYIEYFDPLEHYPYVEYENLTEAVDRKSLNSQFK